MTGRRERTKAANRAAVAAERRRGADRARLTGHRLPVPRRAAATAAAP